MLHQIVIGELALFVFRASTGQFPEAAAQRTLTDIDEIRHLSPARASEGIPVRLIATAIFENKAGDCFVQAGASGIYVKRPPARERFRQGQSILIEGVTDSGYYAPIVREKAATVLGPDRPVAAHVSVEDLFSGAYDCRWVEVTGIVRSMFVYGTNNYYVEMQLAAGPNKLRVNVFNLETTRLDNLVDAKVRLSGAVGGVFTQNREFVAPLLYVHSMQDVVIERPPSVDPYSAPAIPLGKLLRFTPRTSFGHRVKVSGLVTYQRPGKMLVIEEAGQGLLLETREKIAVRPGDVIEAAGFPVMRTYSPVLEDVTYRRLRQGMPPAPSAATAASLLNGTRDAMLVSLEAHLLDSIQQHEERVLFLQADNLAFTAHLAIANWGTVVRDSIDSKLRQGSWLRLTGVCIVEDALEEAAQLKPRSIRLVLRSPEDIVVVREPPWWTTKRLVGALVFALAIILAAFAWVGMLRRRVRQQTELIGRKREHEMLLEERHRIAREFHDTLEQELVGTKMQLDIVADKREEDPEVAAFSLGLARQMVVRSLEEVSGLIWDLRANDLKNGSLAAGLTQLAARVQDLSGMDIQLEVLGGARRLPPLTEHHLLRICQEGLNNAIRHAHARHVRLMLRYEPERVLLQVADDGNGFVLDPQSTDDGHFGIIGMRERTRKIGGELQVQTRPGEGTQITIELFSDSQPGLAPAPNGKGARSDHR